MSGDDMKVLDTLGKSKKAIGEIIAILLCIVAIFFAGMKFADGKEMIRLLQQQLEIN